MTAVKPHIRLATTTFNEAATLPALAKGCEELGISSWVILDDLESSDGTAQVAKELFGHLPGRVIRKPFTWDSLSAKRNYLYNTLRSTRQGCDYLFITQSDEPPIGPWQPEITFTQPIYGLPVVADTISWIAPLLIRSDIPFQWVGRVHEFLDIGATPVSIANSPSIARSGTSATKRSMARHLKLLREDMAAEGGNSPHRARWSFYVAQTLRDLGRTDEAIGAYLRRGQLGEGHPEEIFYCLYMAGYLMERNDVYGAIGYHKRAITLRPHRPEPYFHLHYLYRAIGKTRQANIWLRRGATLPVCPDTMFVNRYMEQEMQRLVGNHNA